jgi:hypothetical protein
MRQEADVPIAKKCKVAFKIQSPSSQGAGAATQIEIMGLGGWADNKVAGALKPTLAMAGFRRSPVGSLTWSTQATFQNGKLWKNSETAKARWKTRVLLE